MTRSSRTEIASQAFWAAGGSALQTLLSLITLLVMVRILGPEAYGLFALGLIFTGLAELLVGGHTADALVQKRHAGRGYANAAFILIALLALLSAIAILAVASLVSIWLSAPQLEILLPAMVVLPLLTALSSVPNQILVRDLRFDALASASVTSSVVAMIAGLSLAVGGVGVWSLLGMEAARRLTTLAVVARAAQWRPGLAFSRADFHGVIGFGLKRIKNHTLQFAAQKATPRLVIGGLLGVEALGLYTVARRLIDQLNGILSSPVASVAFPAAAQRQELRKELEKLISTTIRITAWIYWPVLLGGVLLAPVIFPLVLGAEWLGTVIVFQILGIAALRAPVSSFNSSVLTALGRLNSISLIQLASLLAGVILITLGALNFGLVGAVAGLALRQWLIWPLGAVMIRAATGYPITKQLGVLIHAGAPALIMTAAIIGAQISGVLPDGDLLRALVIFLTGVVLYPIAWSCFNRREALLVWTAMNEVRHGRTARAKDVFLSMVSP